MIQAPQPNPGWEAGVLGGLLHTIGGEITMGVGSVGKGPLPAGVENGLTAGGGRKVAGI